MHKVDWSEAGDYLIAAISGGALVGVILKAFFLGVIGALGGMAAKYCVSFIKKRFFTKDEDK